MRNLKGQTAAVKSIYKYVDPIEIPLGYRFDRKFNSKTQSSQQRKVNETFQYVTIIETLELLMYHPEVREYVNSEKNWDDDWLKSFRDGVNFKTNPFFKKYPQAFRIQLYYDDFVFNNPLGSKVHPHKLGAFYYIIQNLPNHLNSFEGGIHVLAICYTADIDKYGMKALLEPFLNDLEKLESEGGVEIFVNDEKLTLRARLSAVCADGLAAHQLFGLLSPAAYHFCRLCMVSRDDHKNNTNLPANLRNKELHEKQLQNIKSKRTVAECTAAKKEIEVREDSALHASRCFHCTNNFVFDPMHDIFEGIAPYEIKLALSHFLKVKLYKLNIDTFKSRIHLFPYGSTDIKNKPLANFTLSSINNLKDHSLSQTSAQTWCLMRIFPFLVSDKVEEDDEYLKLILLLNQITEIIFSPKVRLSILPYLSKLIEEHDQLFRRLFSDSSKINKLHHLTHYSDCIRHSGPLKLLNCLRFEAKHAFFKKFGSVCCNFKNLPKSMTNLCQLSQCSTWGTNKLPRTKLNFDQKEQIQVVDTHLKEKLKELHFKDTDCVFRVNKINIYGTEYRNDFFVGIDNRVNREDGNVIFGCIKEMIVIKDNVYFWCPEWPVQWLNDSLNAYCVDETNQYCLVNSNDLYDYKPFSLWSDYKTDFSYIVLRHMLL